MCREENSITFECRHCQAGVKEASEADGCVGDVKDRAVLQVEADVYTQETLPFNENVRNAFFQAWADKLGGVNKIDLYDLQNNNLRNPVG